MKRKKIIRLTEQDLETIINSVLGAAGMSSKDLFSIGGINDKLSPKDIEKAQEDASNGVNNWLSKHLSPEDMEKIKKTGNTKKENFGSSLVN